jgi:hypothetical protein
MCRTNAWWFIFWTGPRARTSRAHFSAGATGKKNSIIESGLGMAPMDAEMPAHPRRRRGWRMNKIKKNAAQHKFGILANRAGVHRNKTFCSATLS